MRQLPLLIGACLVLLPEASAQARAIGTLYTANLPGDANNPPGSANIGVNINVGTGQLPGFEYVRQSGVVRLPNGHYLVTSEAAINTSSGHKVFEMASDGTYLATYDQPDYTSLDSRGLRDMGWDMETGPDSRIWSGGENRAISSYDWHNNTFDPNVSVGPTGLKILDGWAGNAVWCIAVADIDGKKVLVSADAPNPDLVNPNAQGEFFPGRPTNWHTIETPAIGVGVPNNPFNAFAKFRDPTPDPTDQDLPLIPGSFEDNQDAGKYGLAYDPVHGTLWYSVDERYTHGNPNENSLRFIEMDLEGNRTGKYFQGSREIIEIDPDTLETSYSGEARGCEFYVDANGDLVLVYMAAFQDEFIVEVHGSFDTGVSCNGGDIGYINDPYLGNLDGFSVTLKNAPDNPLGAAILFRGVAAVNGVQFPGINNCPLWVDLGSFRNMGAFLLNNGETSYQQPIPDDLNLLGFEATWQWLLPTNANVLPLDLSSAAITRVSENF